MIEERGHLDPLLSEVRWQQFLSKLRYRSGAGTPEQFWNSFLSYKLQGIEPPEDN